MNDKAPVLTDEEILKAKQLAYQMVRVKSSKGDRAIADYARDFYHEYYSKLIDTKVSEAITTATEAKDKIREILDKYNGNYPLTYSRRVN